MICVYVICGYMHKCIYEYMNMSMYPCMDMYEERYSKTFYELWFSVKTNLYNWNNIAITRRVRPKSIFSLFTKRIRKRQWEYELIEQFRNHPTPSTRCLLMDVLLKLLLLQLDSSDQHQVRIAFFYFLTWSFMFVAFFIIFYFFYFLYNHSIFCLIK